MTYRDRVDEEYSLSTVADTCDGQVDILLYFCLYIGIFGHQRVINLVVNNLVVGTEQ